MKMTRRRFLANIAGSITVAIFVPYSIWKISTGKASDIVVSILKRRLGYLDIENIDFQLYAEDYISYRKKYQKELLYLSILATPMRHISPYNLLDLAHPLRRLEDNVVSNFLMSTDFFHNHADETKKLTIDFSIIL